MRKLNKYEMTIISESMIRKQIKDWLKQSKNNIINEIRKTARTSLSRDMVMEIAEKVIAEHVAKTIKMSNITELFRKEIQKKVRTKLDKPEPSCPDINWTAIDDMADVIYRGK